KTSTYLWIIFVYIIFFYLNRFFFKYGFFMDEQLIIQNNLGIRYAFISHQEFVLYLLTSCLLFPIWEELVHRVCIMVIFSRFLPRSEEHTSELQSRFDLVCRLLL